MVQLGKQTNGKRGLRRTLGRTIGVVAVTVTALAVATATAETASAHPGPSITPVLSGLNAPRGLTFDGHGNLFVAEAGLAGSGAAGVATGGQVSKYRWHSTTAAWTTGFQAVYETEDPTQPPDVLGPAGVATLAGSCTGDRHGRHGRHADCPLYTIDQESTEGVLAATGTTVPQLGHLFALDRRTGQARDVADVGDQDYAFSQANPTLANDWPDADPFGVLVVRDHWTHRVRVFVADAATNTVDEVQRNGQVRQVAFIPPNPTTGEDSTPTCIAQGRDGELYVGTLDLLANLASPGQSKIWRVDPNASFPTAPTLVATGLTTITSCTIDRHGQFWATEMFAPNATGAPGDIVRLSLRHPDRQTRIGLGSLPLPGGITQGPDGAMYVTVNTAGAPGSGAVMRVRA